MVDDEKQMTFFEHLEELRKRIVVSVIAILITSAVAFYFAFDILDILKRQLPPVNLTYRSIMEPFMLKFKIAVMTGFFLSSPVIFYELLAFFSPALKGKEKRILYPLVFLMVLLFLGGATFGYFYVMPMGVKWLLAQDSGKLIRLLNGSDFLNFTTLFLLAFGVAFETPLVILILVRLGIVSRESLRKNWRVAYLVILVIAAMATPDWSLPPMLILGVSMILLYELTLFLVRWW